MRGKGRNWNKPIPEAKFTMAVNFSSGDDLQRRPFDSGSLCLHFLALFLVVVGARLALVSIYGSPLPILDQWDGEAASTFKPWMDGTLTISDLFRPHNEHRIVLSRLLALGLLCLNGQWDSLLELAGNALICGLIAVAISAAFIQLLGRRHQIAAVTAVMLWFSLPYGQENTLSGFQSSFYFLLFFSLLAIWGLSSQPAFSFRWWLGATGAVLSCFSMASGFFAAAATLGMVCARTIRNRRVTRDVIVTVIFTAAVVGTSLLFRVSVPRHEPLQAASLNAWLIVFSRCLAWPFCDTPVASLIIYLPVALLALRYLQAEGRFLYRKSIGFDRSAPCRCRLGCPTSRGDRSCAGWRCSRSSRLAIHGHPRVWCFGELQRSDNFAFRSRLAAILGTRSLHDLDLNRAGRKRTSQLSANHRTIRQKSLSSVGRRERCGLRRDGRSQLFGNTRTAHSLPLRAAAGYASG